MGGHLIQTLCLIKGELKPAWKPKDGVIYYVPYLDDIDKGRYYQERIWNDTNYGRTMLQYNLMFKTKEEAIAATNKMLNALKE